jgi:hypothetical protein
MRLTSTALLILFSVGCGKTHFVLAPSGADPTFGQTRPDSSVTRNVVLVSIDGLRPDAIATFKAPTLSRLITEGSYTLSARTILPSKTLPSHTSMLTGEPPDRHGVLWNDALSDEPGTLEIPTIFSAARSRGYLLQQVEVLASPGPRVARLLPVPGRLVRPLVIVFDGGRRGNAPQLGGSQPAVRAPDRP